MIELLPHVVISRINRGYVVQWCRYIEDDEGQMVADMKGEAIYTEAELDQLTQDIGEQLVLCGKPLEAYEEDSVDSSDSVNDALRKRSED